MLQRRGLQSTYMFMLPSNHTCPACSLRGLGFQTTGLGLQLGLLGLIIGTRADQKWFRLLAGGYAVVRTCLACIHAIVAWTIPRARMLSLVTAAAGLALAAAPTVIAWQQGIDSGEKEEEQEKASLPGSWQNPTPNTTALFATVA